MEAKFESTWLGTNVVNFSAALDYLCSLRLASDRGMAHVQVACRELFASKLANFNDRFAAAVLVSKISEQNLSPDQLLTMGQSRVVALRALWPYRAGDPEGAHAANLIRSVLANSLGVQPEYEPMGDEEEDAAGHGEMMYKANCAFLT